MLRVVFIGILLLSIIGCGGKKSAPSEPKSIEGKATEKAAPTESKDAAAVGRPIVVIETSMGNIEIELRPDKAPKTVANFLKLAKDGFYNNLTFHRVIPGFVIQGGDPKGDGTGGPGYTVPAEITDLKHTLGAVATARLPDNINPNRESSGSQFYIVVGNASFLDGQYTVFGYVTSGMDVAQKIASVERDKRDKPLQPVYMKKVYVK